MDDKVVQVKEESEIKKEDANITGRIFVKQFHQLLEDPLLKSTSDDVQRAIKGLREIPDEELNEFLDDEDFMKGLDVVDAWERDEDKNREIEQNRTESTKQGKNQISREHHRPEKDKRKKPKKEEKKREETRRDPLKSTKDIERDKMRTKRDTENKLLAEKEKAIKYLLDSDNVVPPGTETEAIQSIAEEQQNRERAQREAQRSREHRRSKSLERYERASPSRRRTPDRSRLSPHRRKSPFVSPDHRRSPFKKSVERHRSPYRYSPSRLKNSPRSYDRRSPKLSPDSRRRSPRRLSGERRSSVERRRSTERRRRRADWMHERRRSRSRDRRSRSMERSRRRLSRSPISRRYSPRRRSRTRSRSLEKRPRKRSSFINELARQLGHEAMSTAVNTSGYVPSATMEGIAPLLNPSTYQQETDRILPPTQPPPPQPSLSPSSSVMLPPMSSGPSFMNFEPMPTASLMNFEPMPPPSMTPTIAPTMTPTSYASGPVMYNQPNAAAAAPPPVMCSPLLSVPSPQPVPPPVMDRAHASYNPSYTAPFVQQSSIRQFEPPKKSVNHSTTSSTSSQKQNYTEHGSVTSYKEVYSPPQERMKTPEPPIISKPKQKTSLSSLLEASVSAKDSSNIPVLYPGFKPEIMRHCEQAIYQLPVEDPRLKMKGRFFYDRSEENNTKDVSDDHTSNSILLQKSKTKIFWKETNAEQSISVPKTTQTHQKICQTDEVETETKGVQVRVTTVDFASQVYADDLQQVKEERRPIMDRLDWSARDTYEYGSKFREVEDLRWSLSNSSQRRTWNRQSSPSRRSDEQEHHLDSMNHESRSSRLDSPIRNNEFSAQSNIRDHYSHDRYSPNYQRRSIERDEFHDRRSNHSRGESPMELEESDDELMTGHTFQRGSDWHGRGKVSRGKSHNLRGKHVGGRSYRSHGNYRGKF
ncbi:PREDICTED: serine/arginine repetitive matrix protein 2-like isoform X1 [Acromyrmex echinatior]|uniref:Serine/arginine repetitive matrix protein 2 n=2 Tax=Acromyrmex echinatior TaxID=103372 RepID=F4WZF2_ACREC|nr:PREDICTED: serine/arginine repetitive matrix protein 2-like isoform X1 [Acromyrmex echinatior]XP_011062650.1 PREDICTED: serine/arginine repetitive matrix protein 2-like isoform X1 [Acromyrmex echinatior]XP_011062652.1 PREDICTED: serine/arginine repetitive matrix protein 2-like isoform X1 [Acromyrmex echinatior]XP_011062653.1 PREDICTED: serine/arginine repetitive matrix protein 2-like isoform X1 [Acromyrmex echinatior]XP_011062654.1 PREDICTED: serine/arginine repetitive matrix protein 2-like 